MLFANKKILGLDIGSSSIKIAELEVSRGPTMLNAFAVIPTPPNAVGTGEIVDGSAIQMAIQSLLKELKTNRKNICVGMWGTAVIVKKITIPKMDKKVIKAQLKFEAEQYIPFDVNNVSLAHYILPGSQTPDTMDILLIAAQNELVNEYTRVITNAKLKPVILDVSGFALANAFEANYGRIKTEIVGLMNFGASVTNFVVIQGGNAVFSRDIPVGGNNFTNEISKSLGVSLGEAEALKLNALAKGEIPEEINHVINMTNEVIADEVRNSLEFLSASTGGIIPNRIYFTGGSAYTLGLIETISKVVSLPFEEMNPFLRIKVNHKRISQSFSQQITPYSSIALGLGLRQVGDE